jgi:uncharacterized repeat protein (TIGR03803 family)
LVVVFAGCSQTTSARHLPFAAQAFAPERHGSGYQLLYSFKGSPDGASPIGGTLVTLHGWLYGTTAYGGANTFGTVYRVSTAGAENVLYSFQRSPDGWYPLAPLLDVDGTIYGTTNGGSPYNEGTVFKITPSGAESVVLGFYDLAQGAEPWAGLISHKGKLYGTTTLGGAGFGNVFETSTSGDEKVLYEFKNEPDGQQPSAPLTYFNGSFYGTTYAGGSGSCSGGCGTVYRITRTGAESVLHSFTGTPDGATPGLSGLIAYHGVLYGTTRSGGSHNAGAVFEITPAGQERILYNFQGPPDGQKPDATLLAYRGNLYGTTTVGGSGCGCGTVFSLTTSGTELVSGV